MYIYSSCQYNVNYRQDKIYNVYLRLGHIFIYVLQNSLVYQSQNEQLLINAMSIPGKHMKHPPRSPTQRVPTERDGNYDKPEFVQPQEETLMSIVWN